MVQRSVSLVEQLIHEMASEISSGNLVSDGGRLPSEADLSERYSVSRATIREALSKLELAGIIIRRHGVGTFVNHLIRNQPGLIWGWLDEASAFVELIARSGHTPASKVLSVTIIPAGSVAGHLSIAPEAPVVSIEKLFFADKVPVIYSRTAIPRDFVEPIEERTLSADNYQSSTYQLLADRSQRKVRHQNSEVRAVLADKNLSIWLNCQQGDPLLQVEEIGYDADQTALFYALHHFRGDRVSFRQTRIPSFTIDRLWHS